MYVSKASMSRGSISRSWKCQQALIDQYTTDANTKRANIITSRTVINKLTITQQVFVIKCKLTQCLTILQKTVININTGSCKKITVRAQYHDCFSRALSSHCRVPSATPRAQQTVLFNLKIFTFPSDVLFHALSLYV